MLMEIEGQLAVLGYLSSRLAHKESRLAENNSIALHSPAARQSVLCLFEPLSK
jgi:hypothetical protein